MGKGGGGAHGKEDSNADHAPRIRNFSFPVEIEEEKRRKEDQYLRGKENQGFRFQAR